jgi:hypothetical protein
MRRLLPVVAAFTVLAWAEEAWAQAGPETLKARGRRWRAQMDGDMSSDNLGLAGTDFDLSSDANLDEDEPDINDIGLIFGMGSIGRINLQYWWGEFQGSDTLTRDIFFGGSIFNSGVQLDTKVEWKVWSVLFEYMMPGPGLMGASMLYGQAGFKQISMEAELVGGGVGAESDFEGLCPAVGFRGSMMLSTWITLEAEVNGFFMKSLSGGIEGTMWDVSVSAVAKLGPAYGGVGYRILTMDATDDDADVEKFEVDIEIKGIFIEVGVKF